MAVKADTIISMIRAHMAGDGSSFQEAAKQAAHEARGQGHTVVATQIQRALLPTTNHSYGIPERHGTQAAQTPVRDGDFWAASWTTENLEDLILPTNTKAQLRGIIEDIQCAPRLRNLGFEGATRAILTGPPGTGKTHAAKAIARECHQPLSMVHLDSLVSSYIGQTAERLSQVFEAAQEMNAILFLDEVDALARERDDPGETGEIKRVVIALLQLLDRHADSVTVLAATNHSKVLDSAIWRRFPEHIEFPMPGPEERGRIFERLLRAMEQDVSPRTVQRLVDASEGLSGAMLRQVLRRGMRAALYRGKARADDEDFLTGMHTLTAFEKPQLTPHKGAHAGSAGGPGRPRTFSNEQLREAKLMFATQKEIAAHLGVTQSAVCKRLKLLAEPSGAGAQIL